MTYSSQVHMKKQAGFTLVELLIVMSILTIIASAYLFNADTSSSRGKTLFSSMQALSDAAARFSIENSGCYPLNVQVLFDSGEASKTSLNSCSADLSGMWNGPYMKTRPLNSSGEWEFAGIAPEATLGFRLNGGAFEVQATNIPTDVAAAAIKACNGGKLSSSYSACETGSTTGNTTTIYYSVAP